jgi:hypothetical protein
MRSVMFLIVAAGLCGALCVAADGPPASVAGVVPEAASEPASKPAAAGVVVYDPDPAHLFNRLHRAMAVRTIDGVDYGTDNAVPFFLNADDLLSGDLHSNLVAVLDELLRSEKSDRLPDALRRALLQHEAWTTIDLTIRRTLLEAPVERKALRARLAKAVALLALSDAEIAKLPNNYAQAVESGVFPKDYDPANPDKTFLPPDLFDVHGPWVEISSDDGQSVAPTHVGALAGRSAFRIFIRCPGERKDTLAYIQTLNLYTTPWALEPATIATSYPDGKKVRWNPLRADRNTPQFPEGTMFALVRQMNVINDKLELRSTPITQSVQLRVYRNVGEGVGHSIEEAAKAQAFFELNMRRGDLLAGKAGGLYAVGKDDVEYQLFPISGHNEELGESAFRGQVGMARCVTCHTGNGIFSVRSYGRGTNPQFYPAPHADHSPERSRLLKVQRFEWGLLQGMLEADGAGG